VNRAARRAAARNGDRPPSVVLCYLHPGEVSAAFMSSVLRCRDYEVQRTGALFGVSERRARSNSIAKARNIVTQVFLQSPHEWLWFVDADIGFPAAALHQLLSVADPAERPVVSGLYFGHRTEGYDEETNAELFGCVPVIGVWDIDGGEVVGFKFIEDYPRDQACRVHTSGAGMLLIHRSVLEEMHAKYGLHWWTQTMHPTRPEPFGEDTSFFLRLYEMDVPVFAHTGVRCSHDKPMFWTEQTWDAQRERQVTA